MRRARWFFVNLQPGCGGAGSLFCWSRIYVGGKWTPFVWMCRRYPWASVWRGVWPKKLE